MRQALKDTVYISGCSHSHHWYLNQDLKNSWTTQLGFNTVYNHSICGSSNDFIARRAWMFCETYKPELAIVQWTNLTRSESIGPSAETDQVEGWKQRLADDVDNTSDVDVHFLICDNDFKKQDSSFYWSTFYGPWNNDNNSKAFVQTYDFQTAFCNLIKNAFLLQSYFKSIEQPYLFVNGTDWFHASDMDPDHIEEYGAWHALDFLNVIPEHFALNTVKPLADQIDKTRWPDVNITRDIVDIGDDNSHGGLQTNKNFAKQIKAELEKLNAGNRK